MSLSPVRKTNMDETSKAFEIKRNVSFGRRLSAVGGNSFGVKRARVSFMIIVLGLGILCGNFVCRLFFSEKKETHIKNVKRHSIHEPPSSRTGLSIKKDMSIQFRDYLPKHIFITTGSWYQQKKSLELFLKTYPNAKDYYLYCFLLDSSERHFFTPIKKITIIEGQVISDTNTTFEKRVKRFGKPDVVKNVSSIDFGAWLMDTFHQDDYIIVRMDSADEVAIARRLHKTGALDWIDKYYTSTTDNSTFSKVLTVLKEMNALPYIWTNEEMTYDDLNNLTSIDESLTTTSVFKTCGYYDQFIVVFYVPFVNEQAIYSLEVMKSFATQVFLKTAVFLSTNFVLTQKELTESLIHLINVGVFLENKTKEDSVPLFNTIRNDFIEVRRIFKNFDSNPVELQYVLTKSFSDEFNSKLCNDRSIDVFSDVKKINYLVPYLVKNDTVDIENINRKQNQILAIDLTEIDSEMLLIYILTNFRFSMLTIDSC